MDEEKIWPSPQEQLEADEKFFEEYKKLCRKHGKIIRECMICERMDVSDLEEDAFVSDVFEKCRCD